MKFNYDVYKEVEFSTKTFSELERIDYIKFTTKKEKVMKKTVYSTMSKRYQKLNELEKNIKGLFDMDFESVKFDELRAYLTEAIKYLHQQQQFWEENEFPNAFLRIIEFLVKKFAQEINLPKNSNFVFIEKEIKKLNQQYKEKIQQVKEEEYLEDLQISEHEEQEMTEESGDEGLDKMDFSERLQFPPELRRMFWMKVQDTVTDEKKETKERQKDRLRGQIQLKKNKENEQTYKQKEFNINDLQQVQELILEDQETIKDKDYLQLQLKIDQYNKLFTIYKQQENVLNESFYLNQLQIFERLFEYELEENSHCFKNIVETTEYFLNNNNSEKIKGKLIKVLYLIMNLLNRTIDSMDILNKNLGSILNQQQSFIQRQYLNIYWIVKEDNQIENQDKEKLCVELLDSIYYLQNYKWCDLGEIIQLIIELLDLNVHQKNQLQIQKELMLLYRESLFYKEINKTQEFLNSYLTQNKDQQSDLSQQSNQQFPEEKNSLNEMDIIFWQNPRLKTQMVHLASILCINLFQKGNYEQSNHIIKTLQDNEDLWNIINKEALLEGSQRITSLKLIDTDLVLQIQNLIQKIYQKDSLIINEITEKFLVQNYSQIFQDQNCLQLYMKQIQAIKCQNYIEQFAFLQVFFPLEPIFKSFELDLESQQKLIQNLNKNSKVKIEQNSIKFTQEQKQTQSPLEKLKNIQKKTHQQQESDAPLYQSQFRKNFDWIISQIKIE